MDICFFSVRHKACLHIAHNQTPFMRILYHIRLKFYTHHILLIADIDKVWLMTYVKFEGRAPP